MVVSTLRARKVESPALVARITQSPDVDEDAVTVVPESVHGPEMTLKVTAPVPEPPVAVTVPVAPRTRLVGAVKVSAA